MWASLIYFVKELPKNSIPYFQKWLNDPFKFIYWKCLSMGLSTFSMSVKNNFFQICEKFQFHTLKISLELICKHRIMCKLSKERPTCHMISLFWYFPLNQFRETLTSILLTWEASVLIRSMLSPVTTIG